MVTAEERQAIVDEEDLRLLPVTYWVLGSMNLVFMLYGLLYVGMGIMFVVIPVKPGESPPPAAFAWFFILFGLAFMLGFGIDGALKILAGFWIRARRRRVMCLVIAGLSCAWVPFGTMVGVFTFLTLARPSVIALFDAPPAQGASPVEPPEPQAPSGEDAVGS